MIEGEGGELSAGYKRPPTSTRFVKGRIQRCPQLQRSSDAIREVPQPLKVRGKIIRILLARLADDQAVLNLENSQAFGGMGRGSVHIFSC